MNQFVLVALLPVMAVIAFGLARGDAGLVTLFTLIPVHSLVLFPV